MDSKNQPVNREESTNNQQAILVDWLISFVDVFVAVAVVVAVVVVGVVI